MKNWAFILTLFVVSCSGNEEESNPMDYEDFVGETGVELQDSTELNTDTLIDLSTYKGRLINALSSDYIAIENDKFNTLDRFSFEHSEKIGFEAYYDVPYGKDLMVVPVANFFYYSFKDSTTTKNAFYNYLDGLSESGESGAVKINQDMESIKSPPLFLLVYDTMIISTEYLCEHANNSWESMQDSIESIYGTNYLHRIEIDCGGPLKWAK